MFDIEKTIHTAAYLLWKRGGIMPSRELMKLLYLAEREMLLRHGESLTGDKLLSMKEGPVLSAGMNLFACEKLPEQWNTWIAPKVNGDLCFRKLDEVNPSCPEAAFDDLSKAERSVLDDVYERHGALCKRQISDRTQIPKACPEWQGPHGSPAPIRLKALLTLHGKTEKEADAIIDHLREVEAMRKAAQALT